ncbi:MAG: hypothetical protein ACK47B_16660 [Armatimonadota bacterium]
MASSRRTRRGQALVVAILALTILVTAAIALSGVARMEVRAARRGVDAVRREALLRGAVSRGIALLDQGRTDSAALLDALRRYRELRWEPVPELSGPDQPPLQVALQLVDTCSRLNVNTADRETLERLEAVDKDTVSEILAWREEDRGDDDETYSGTPRPYDPKDRPFDTVEELLMVRGVEPPLFYGPPTVAEARSLRYPPLTELLTTFSGDNNTDPEGHPRADLNRASAEELIEAANRGGNLVTRRLAETIVQRREERERQRRPPFRSVLEAVVEAMGNGGDNSQFFDPSVKEEDAVERILYAWTADRRSFAAGKVNLNTAPPLVLRTLGWSDTQLQALMEKRRERPDGFRWVDLIEMVLSPMGLGGNPGDDANSRMLQRIERAVSVRSSTYLVRCLVRDPQTGRVDAVAATVYWPASPDEAAQIVQWREPDRYPGWSAWYRVPGEEEGATSDRNGRQ